ncbi:hypothetical protein LT493_40990 [Streptomyces tricolor]|nr:hypothetical protein [Streptomyces tricolor]
MAAVLEKNVATPLTRVVVPNRLHRGDRLFQDDIDHATWYSRSTACSPSQQHRHHPGHRRTRQDPAPRPTRSSTRTCASSASRRLHRPRLPRRDPRHPRAPPQKWSTSQQYTIPFGQGFSINAMQAASVYSHHR